MCLFKRLGLNCSIHLDCFYSLFMNLLCRWNGLSMKRFLLKYLNLFQVLRVWNDMRMFLFVDDLSLHQAVSEGEEEAGDRSREGLEQSCEQAREQLTNSIRMQWRKLKSHMERLDSQGTTCGCCFPL